MEQKPVAYLRFFARQWLVSPDFGMDGDEGLETCRKDEIGDDGTQAFPVFTADQLKAEREKAIIEVSNKVSRYMLTNADYTYTDMVNLILALLSTNESKENEVKG